MTRPRTCIRLPGTTACMHRRSADKPRRCLPCARHASAGREHDHDCEARVMPCNGEWLGDGQASRLHEDGWRRDQGRGGSDARDRFEPRLVAPAPVRVRGVARGRCEGPDGRAPIARVLANARLRAVVCQADLAARCGPRGTSPRGGHSANCALAALQDPGSGLPPPINTRGVMLSTPCLKPDSNLAA